jgi:hypothetical protein
MWELSPLYPGAKMLCCCVGGLETIGNHPSIDIYHLEELLSTFTYSTIQYRTVQYSTVQCNSLLCGKNNPLPILQIHFSC